MKKIFLLDEYYSDSRYALHFFEQIIKEKMEETSLTKDGYLKNIGINRVSYQRAKEKKQKIGNEISNILHKHLNYNKLDLKYKRAYENLIESIYKSFYYRKENLFIYEEELLCYIKQNTILNPIFNLFLLLIRLTRFKNPKEVLSSNSDLYNSIKKYGAEYYSKPFLDVILFIDILYVQNDVSYKDINYFINDSQIKGLMYFGLMSHSYLIQKYDLCVYYGQECRKFLIQDMNFPRLLSLNLTLMTCYNNIFEFEKAYDIALKQLDYLNLFDDKENILYATRIHWLTAALGLKKYNEIEDDIIYKEELDYYDYIFLLLVNYIKSEKEFNVTCKYYYNKYKLINSKYNCYVDYLIKYLKKQTKQSLDVIMNTELNIGLKSIISSL